ARGARGAPLGGPAGALLGVGLDRLLGGGAVLWAAAITFAAGAVLALSLPAPRRRRERDPGAASRRDPMDRRGGGVGPPPGGGRVGGGGNTLGGGGGGGHPFLLALGGR